MGIFLRVVKKEKKGSVFLRGVKGELKRSKRGVKGTIPSPANSFEDTREPRDTSETKDVTTSG